MTKSVPQFVSRLWTSIEVSKNFPHGPVTKFDSTPGGSGANVANQDALRRWSLLLGKLKARHGLPVPGSELGKTQPAPIPTISPDVEECLNTLELMYDELRQALHQRQLLEQEVSDVQAALERAHIEIIGARDSERQARHQARHDSLTLLPNRCFFREKLDEALADAVKEKRELAVMYIDLDGFKPINDLYGHDVGDKLLVIVAARLAHAVRAGDMVSRLGGDEFGCLVTDLPPSCDQLGRMASDLYDAVSAPCSIGDRSFTVHPSIGIARYPTDGLTPRGLLNNADMAMYRAKSRQTKYEFFNPYTGSRF